MAAKRQRIRKREPLRQQHPLGCAAVVLSDFPCWCPCYTLAVVALLALASVSAVQHWIVENGRIIEPQDGLDFRGDLLRDSHLSQFVFHVDRLSVMHSMGSRLDEILYGYDHDQLIAKLRYPDLLSKSRDYNATQELNPDDFLISAGPFLAHAGISIHDHVDLHSAPKNTRVNTPICDHPMHSSSNAFNSLEGIRMRSSLKILPEEGLADLLWLEAEKRGPKALSSFMTNFGRVVGMALAENPEAWALYHLGSLYWRVMGEAEHAIDCARRSLYFAPTTYQYLPLCSLANIFVRAGFPSDATFLLDAAQSINQNFYTTFLLHGIALVHSERIEEANIAFDTAIVIQPTLKRAYELQILVLNELKKRVALSRREREINFRKAYMVLQPSLTWDHFDYETPLDRCAGAVCPENAQCNPSDGRCHCGDGYLSQNGTCVVDEQCNNVTCVDQHSVCRAGQCYCDFGYHAVDNHCIVDLCAGVECVENSACNPADGYCHCVRPFLFFGVECVTDECSGVTCSPHSFCHLGKCFCHLGYQAQGNVCVPEQDCSGDVRCPLHAECDPIDGHCRCNDGYYAATNASACVPASDSGDEEPLSLREQVELVNEKIQSDALTQLYTIAGPEVTVALRSDRRSRRGNASSDDSDSGGSGKTPSPITRSVDGSIRSPDITEGAILTAYHPSVLVGTQPGTPSDLFSAAELEQSRKLKDTRYVLAEEYLDLFAEDVYLSKEVCTRRIRTLPHWANYPGTFIAPVVEEGKDYASAVDLDVDVEQGAQPKCDVRTEHLAKQAYLSLGAADLDADMPFVVEKGMQYVGELLFGSGLADMDAYADLVSFYLQLDPSSAAFCNFATLYWRSRGSFKEAYKCIQRSLAAESSVRSDAALLNAANILFRTNQLEAARDAALYAAAITEHHHAIVHYTLGNIYGALRDVNHSVSHYKHALRYQPKLTLAALSLKRMMCIQRFPLRVAPAPSSSPSSPTTGATVASGQYALGIAELERKVKKAKKIKQRLDAIRAYVGQQHNNADAAVSLKSQLKLSEDLLKGIFVSLQLDPLLVKSPNVVSSQHFHVRKGMEGPPVHTLDDFDLMSADLLQEYSDLATQLQQNSAQTSASGTQSQQRSSRNGPSLRPSLDPQSVVKNPMPKTSSSLGHIRAPSSSPAQAALPTIFSMADDDTGNGDSSGSSAPDLSFVDPYEDTPGSDRASWTEASAPMMGIDSSISTFKEPLVAAQQKLHLREHRAASMPKSGIDALTQTMVMSSHTAAAIRRRPKFATEISEIVKSPSLPSLMVYIRETVIPECDAEEDLDDSFWPHQAYCSELLGLSPPVLNQLEQLSLSAATSQFGMEVESASLLASSPLHRRSHSIGEQSDSSHTEDQSGNKDDAGNNNDKDDGNDDNDVNDEDDDAGFLTDEETMGYFHEAAHELLERIWETSGDHSLITDIDLDLLIAAVDDDVTLPRKKSGAIRKILPICKPYFKGHSLFDDIPGVADRNAMRSKPSTAEVDLVHLFSALGTTMSDFGTKMRVKMKTPEENNFPWITYHAAALYWRAVGNSTQAIECLRNAIEVTPAQFQHNILISLTQVLLGAGHHVDAISTAETLVRLRPFQAMSHRTMANVLQSLGPVVSQETMFFYETSVRIDPSQELVKKRLATLMCSKKYLEPKK